ncbi:MAG: hypothetical protein KJ006_03310 [Thermoleophilia bacterium]|nr:hypothetical protein [Thermoleophilia bacterium]GIK76979.1 MAG: hypothetical protein BroJett022_06690 [Actinomycetes bacterium]
MSRTDLAIGICLGIAIALVALALYVFGGGAGESIDAPSLDQSTPAAQQAGQK